MKRVLKLFKIDCNRLTVGRWWIGKLLLILLCPTIYFIFGMIGGAVNSDIVTYIMFGIAFIAIQLISILQNIKRFNDIGIGWKGALSYYICLILTTILALYPYQSDIAGNIIGILVPIFGIITSILLIIMMFISGKDKNNKYGKSPYSKKEV